MVKHIYRGYEYDIESKERVPHNLGGQRPDLIYRGVHHDGVKERREDGVTGAPGPLWYRGHRMA